MTEVLFAGESMAFRFKIVVHPTHRALSADGAPEVSVPGTIIETCAPVHLLVEALILGWVGQRVRAHRGRFYC